MKGTVDPICFGNSDRSLLRDSGEYVDGGWYCVDDNFRRIDGPYGTREACQAACDRINAE